MERNTLISQVATIVDNLKNHRDTRWQAALENVSDRSLNQVTQELNALGARARESVAKLLKFEDKKVVRDLFQKGKGQESAKKEILAIQAAKDIESAFRKGKISLTIPIREKATKSYASVTRYILGIRYMIEHWEQEGERDMEFDVDEDLLKDDE